MIRTYRTKERKRTTTPMLSSEALGRAFDQIVASPTPQESETQPVKTAEKKPWFPDPDKHSWLNNEDFYIGQLMDSVVLNLAVNCQDCIQDVGCDEVVHAFRSVGEEIASVNSHDSGKIEVIFSHPHKPFVVHANEVCERAQQLFA